MIFATLVYILIKKERKKKMNIFKFIERRRTINDTARELNRLSDRELRDIGISRSNIYCVARGTA